MRLSKGDSYYSLWEKLVEYASLIVFRVSRNNKKFGKQINPISNNCLWNYRY